MASLLLRLFHSDYFSPHLALSYLKTYSDNIGITYYLVSQLETAFPSQDVEFYWPQLCHLLITKPSESRALESFILRRCEESVHVALLTLWYFQASLSDLSSNPHTASFQVCHRIFNQCQRILFEDPLGETRQETGSSSRWSSSHWKSKLARKLSPSNPAPAIVGMGAVLASTPGMPKLASVSGTIAIEQGRGRLEGLEGAGTRRQTTDGSDDGFNERESFDSQEEEEEHSFAQNGQADGKLDPSRDRVRDGGIKSNGSNPQPEAQRAAAATSGMGQIDKGKKPDNAFASFALGFNELKDKAAAAVGDVFGQGFGHEASKTTSSNGRGAAPAPPWHPQKERSRVFSQKAANSRSVPNLLPARGSMSGFASSTTLPSESASQTEAMLALYDAEARRRLLRSNYCRVQTQFLLSLQDISSRLLLLPKPARLSALRAELTALNHKLPSEVCFPLWCTADDKDGAEGEIDPTAAQSAKREKDTTSGRHHRVVRINPSEAVVLNSADRVPFLLHVEVLNNDLDFDPERRQNRESLRKLVAEEDVRRRKTAFARASHVKLNETSGTEPESGTVKHLSEEMARTRTASPAPEKGGSSAAQVAAQIPPLGDTSLSFEPQSQLRSDTGAADSPEPPTTPPPMPEEEEVDLTEQAYGSDLAGFGEERDPSSSDEDDLAERNRTHDTAAWTYAKVKVGGASPEQHNRRPSIVGGHQGRKRDFSLDEYAERMRTAAIMLAQLNKSTNAGAQPVVTHNPHVSATAQGGWSSWIIGTSWASTNAPSENSDVGQGSAAGVKSLGNGSAAKAAPRVSIAGNETSAAQAVLAHGGSKLMHADTEGIRKRIMQEMMALEEERMQRMKMGGRNLGRHRGPNRGIEDEETVLRAVNKDDPSAAMFREPWAAKKARIRSTSPYGHLPSWDVFSVIVKTGADLRQEQLAVQLINEFGRIWKETGSRCWVRYFRILVTSEDSGLMETISDAVSIHSIKKDAYSRHVNEGKISTYSLYDHYTDTFGDPSSAKFGKARDKFIESLAGYSIISYLLQIKDRHNGNILVDSDGRLIREFRPRSWKGEGGED
ncbi:hypothetical protein IE53DRAFT_315921 [Violaceomyces palustris]|uniref:Uncharacterized protein n=1 Tax=Violaceomyces palustris TaxID=1673888 RepID=A0ACD0NXB3_9BASI|nr:hypothetical protein IE53DRAFT_315921 [Violaceomyces palustris]